MEVNNADLVIFVSENEVKRIKMDNTMMECHICHTGYSSPVDDDEHTRRHTEYCRKARLASKYAASKNERKDFDYFMKHAEGDLVEIVGLGEFRFPEEERHRDAPLFLKRNSLFSRNRIEWLQEMSCDGYVTITLNNDGCFYHLTYKGFECLASWMDRDLVCTPVE